MQRYATIFYSHSAFRIHLFCSCSFTQQVWHCISLSLGLINQTPSQDMQTVDWWLEKRAGLNKLQRRGLDSAFMLPSWRLWKEKPAGELSSSGCSSDLGGRPTMDTSRGNTPGHHWLANGISNWDWTG